MPSTLLSPSTPTTTVSQNYEGKGEECEEKVVVAGEACQLARKVNTLSGIRKGAAEVDLSNYPWVLI